MISRFLTVFALIAFTSASAIAADVPASTKGPLSQGQTNRKLSIPTCTQDAVASELCRCFSNGGAFTVCKAGQYCYRGGCSG